MAANPRSFPRIIAIILVILVALNVGLVLLQVWPDIQSGRSPLDNLAVQPTQADPATNTPTPTQTTHPLDAAITPLPSLAAPVVSHPDGLRQDGLILLSMRDGNYSHLFAYHPLYLPLTRLTNDAWDDESPAVSPDGTRVAFSSRRNGYWNIYILDLTNRQVSQVTDTPEYDGAPTWSPDMQWLAYESYQDDNLEIMIQSLADPSQTPIRLTDNPGIDSSPDWSPQGREIAFISNRSGDMDVWVARLDIVDDRFRNISRTSGSRETHPAWSPDGLYLAWASAQNGVDDLYIQDMQKEGAVPFRAVSGDWPIWSPDSKVLLSEVRSPNLDSLIGYNLADLSLIYPIVHLPGSLSGIVWKTARLPDLYLAYPLPEGAAVPAGALYNASLSLRPMPPNGRFGIVPLDDVSAPYPYLNDAVDESFANLRKQTGLESGWDFLSSLAEAYSPLTEPLSPDTQENWLLTGRAIAVNPMPALAGWMVTVKEDYAGQTYWRIYLKARYQDGSQGKPMTITPWDINARYLGQTRAYEAGGAEGSMPSGYWIDFTELASRFGWKRLASLATWRSYFPSIRFNQFVLDDNLDWNTALAEVYPADALMTTTPRPTYTPTATETPEEVFTPTNTATVTLTPTLHPTLTPKP